MIINYELSFPDEEVVLNHAFPDKMTPYEVSAEMLKQAMLMRHTNDHYKEWTGKSILTNVDTKESWDIVSEDYIKTSATTNILQFNQLPITPTYRYIVYPGSFDPFHCGHKDVINRVQKYFPWYTEFVVLIQDNPFKKTLMFNREYRLEHAKSTLKSTNTFVTWTSSAYLSSWISNFAFNKVSKLDIKGADTKQKYNMIEVNIVIGDDCLDTIESWHDYANTLNNGYYRFVVVQRNKSMDEILRFNKVIKNMIVIPHNPSSDTILISSTTVRNEIVDLLTKYAG